MKLSLKKFGWKCVLGAEVGYLLCLIGASLPWYTLGGAELNRALFETLPGFTWINPGSIILGAVYMFVFAWIFAWYFVWMHNSSLDLKQ